MSEYKTKGCIDCPMFDDGHYYEYEQVCKHPLAPNQFYEPTEPNREVPRIEVVDNGEEFWHHNYKETPITPDWCPLKKEAIRITLI